MTKIEWVKNPPPPGIKVDAHGRWHDPAGKFSEQGFTWNPITGCLNHFNGMCKGGGFPCYAYKLAHGRVKRLYLKNINTAPVNNPNSFQESNGALNDPFYPRFWPSRLKISNSKKPRGIFACDMSDLFGIGVPEVWTKAVLDEIKRHPTERFYLLTKQPQNLIKYSPFPDNCWVGDTVTANGFAPEAYYSFSHVQAKVKFISFEPLMGQIGSDELKMLATVSDWWISGAQTKPYKPPRIEWVKEIVDAADKASIPVFLKDNLLELVNYKSPETDFAFNLEGLYRQEMPK